MKVIVSITVFFMLTSTALYAQTSVVLHENPTENKDTVVWLKLFTVKYLGGKNYLHWVIAKGSEDGLYAVYRSGDGINFELIGSVKGVGTNVYMDISHYIIDDCPYPGATNYYKLLYITEGFPAFSSDVINIKL